MAKHDEQLTVDMEKLREADSLATIKITNINEVLAAIVSIFGHGAGQFIISAIRQNAGDEAPLITSTPPSNELKRYLATLMLSGFIWGWRYRRVEQGETTANSLKSFSFDQKFEC